MDMAEAPVRKHGSLVPQILLQEGDVPGAGLTVTWVDVALGSGQRPHDHGAEQVCVVQGGRRETRIGRVERVNLVCVSDAAPAMEALAAYGAGQISPRVQRGGIHERD